MGKWEDLSLNDKHELMKIFMDGGIENIEDMKATYENAFNNGGYAPSEDIKNYLKRTEGFVDHWYEDGNGVPTIGYGFTGKYFRDKYPNGMTREQADREFDRVVDKFAGYVKTYTPNYDSLKQNQKDALLSYMYNVGPGNYQTKHPEFIEALRDKDYDTAAKYMNIGYNDSRNPGLRKRRDYERSLFLGKGYTGSQDDAMQRARYVQAPQQETQNDEEAYKDLWFASLGVSPEVRNAAAVGSIAYRPEEQLFNDTTPLSSFNYSGEYVTPYQARQEAGARPRPQVQNKNYDIPTNETILEQLFNNINAQQDYDYTGNLFVKGGPTEEERQQAIAAVLANRGNVNVAPVSFDDTQFQAQKDAVNVRYSPVVEQAMQTQEAPQFKQLTDEAYFTEGKLLGETDKAMIRNRMSQMKTPEQVKEFQKTLVEHGYDIGKSGIDGKFGKKTRAAAQKYFDDIIKNRQQLQEERIEAVEPVTQDPYALSSQMYQNIPTIQKLSSLIDTTIPSHVGAYLNKRALAREGKRLGIDNYDAYIADEIEAASEELAKARKSGKESLMTSAKQRLTDARSLLKENKLNRAGLSGAEKKAAMAILTGINGGKQMTYDDYKSNVELIGGEDGSFLGSNSRHKHKKTGKDVMLYDGRGGYNVMNAAEDSRGGIEDKAASEGWIANVIDAEKRIYNDPNRGRLGGFSYYIDESGNIHIYDRLEATEKKAARGANDKENYNAARDFFPRSSTSEIRDVITSDEYRKYIETVQRRVARKEKRKSKKA